MAAEYFLYAIERHEGSPQFQENLFPEEMWSMVLNSMAQDFKDEPQIITLWLRRGQWLDPQLGNRKNDSVLLWRRARTVGECLG